MKTKIYSLIIAGFISCIAVAQKQVEVTLKLRDGSNVTGTTSLADINLTTDYGKLTIPTKNINSIKVGIPTDKAVQDKAKSFLSQLNNSNDELKKGAYDELVKLGIKAIPAVYDFIADPKNNIEYSGEFTPDNALNELKANANVSDYTDGKDIIEIDGMYTIGGNYEFAKLDVKTEYGNLSIPKEKIDNIDVMFINSDGSNEQSFKLVASKNISANTNGGWLKTGIMLKSGQRFSIQATGEVVYQVYLIKNTSQMAATNHLLAKNIQQLTDEYSSSTTYPSYGNVVYKIGETNNTALKAGAKFSGSATTSGMLYIAIYETVYNAANTGSYNVKISLK
jgi:hypothetical protein